MRNLRSEKLQSIFALLNYENAEEKEIENEVRLTPAVNFENTVEELGENVSVIFLDKFPAGKFKYLE